jgi:hypothetical protein
MALANNDDHRANMTTHDWLRLQTSEANPCIVGEMGTLHAKAPKIEKERNQSFKEKRKTEEVSLIDCSVFYSVTLLLLILRTY